MSERLNEDSTITNPSIEAYKQYGIQPSKLRFMVNNLFYMPEEYKDCLEVYVLSEEYTTDFLSNIKDGMYLTISESYQIIYHKTDPTKLLRRAEYTSVKLSFRVADPIFNIIPTVLVMEIK